MFSSALLASALFPSLCFLSFLLETLALLALSSESNFHQEDFECFCNGHWELLCPVKVFTQVQKLLQVLASHILQTHTPHRCMCEVQVRPICAIHPLYKNPKCPKHSDSCCCSDSSFCSEGVCNFPKTSAVVISVFFVREPCAYCGCLWGETLCKRVYGIADCCHWACFT